MKIVSIGCFLEKWVLSSCFLRICSMNGGFSANARQIVNKKG